MALTFALFTVANAWGQATTEARKEAPAYAPSRERDAAGRVIGPGRVGWWNDRVFYQIFVRSFQDSQSGPLANDGIGDIQGLIDRLDYLKARPSGGAAQDDPAAKPSVPTLGVGGIWLMPMSPSPSYHGYDVTDYYGINPEYGTLDDFRRLIRLCQERDLRIIVDLVLNHSSSQHEWFKLASDAQHPKHDWFIWAGKDPGYRGPWGQKVWHKPKDVPQWYYGLFGPHMPDLNYRNAAVTEEMAKVVRFWLEKGEKGVGVDGYRLDAIRHLIEDGQQQDNTLATHEWLKKFRGTVRSTHPEAFTIGEVWAEAPLAASYVGDQLDACFEFDLGYAMIDAVRFGDARRVREAQEQVLKLYPPNQYGRFLSNHDQTRVLTTLSKPEPLSQPKATATPVRTATSTGMPAKAMRAAAALLLLGPGVPFIYYGEELGMTGDKPDENLRTPMQWTGGANAGFTGKDAKPWRAVNRGGAQGFEKLNVDAAAKDAASLLNWYRTLIRVRTEQPALLYGDVLPVETMRSDVYACLRTHEGQSVLVVVNLSPRPIEKLELSMANGPLRGSLVGDEMLAAGPLLAPIMPDMQTGAMKVSIGGQLPAYGAFAFVLRGAR